MPASSSARSSRTSVSVIVVIATLQVARVIILESFLSFLGLGVQPPTPAWGNMLGEGRVYMLNSWWIAAFPGTGDLRDHAGHQPDGQRPARLARPPHEAVRPAPPARRPTASESPSFRLSLVVPCYNEVANIRRGVLEMLGAFTEADDRFLEVIVVDDGSTDTSRELTAAAARRFSKFGLVENRHQGKALAVIAGIRRARSEYVMFSDMDLATPLTEAEKLFAEAQRGYDLVIGSRLTERPGAPFHRRALAWGLLTVRDRLLGLATLRDTQCGFKLFRRPSPSTSSGACACSRRPAASSAPPCPPPSIWSSSSWPPSCATGSRRSRWLWRHVENRSVRVVKDSVEALADIARIAYFARTRQYTRP